MHKRIQWNLTVLAALFALLLWCTFAQAGYIDNSNGTVTDNGTGLMWQQATAPSTYTWQQALAYCESLDFAGHTDWRLPTAKELESLTDKSQNSPSINITYFPDTVALYYWSSTPDTSYSGGAWGGNFLNGNVGFYDKTFSFHVRAVRSGQSGSFANLTLWPVPDTGQTTCYNQTGVITCPLPGQAFYGQDASYSINTPSYTKLAAGCTLLPDNASTWAMVRDDVTGLIWEEKHNQDNVRLYTDPNDADNIYTWYDSNPATNGGNAGTSGNDTESFISALNSANYGGYSDWRLPTDKELQTIVDFGRYDPAINTVYFPSTVVSDYWSSTSSYALNSYKAWYVDFFYGGVDFGDKGLYHYVRAVRSGLCGSFGDLFISKSGTGAGTVASADSKINCGIDCVEAYTQGTVVTLTATAGSGSTFEVWSGGSCSGTGQCVVTVTGVVNVTAQFGGVSTTTTTFGGGGTTTTTISGGGGGTTTILVTTSTKTSIRTNNDGLCAAQTALGADNPDLENLRAFRDSTLAQSAVGRRIIQIYYNNAESVNAALERSPALRAVARSFFEAAAWVVGGKE